MLDKLIVISTDYLIQKNVIDEDDRDVYEYGFHSIYSRVVNLTFVLVVSIWLNQLAQTIVYHIAFSIMRSVAGGFHANTRLKCFLISMSIWLSSLWAINNVVYPVFLTLIPVLLVWVLAPVEHYNNPLSDKKRNKMKFMSRFFSIILFAIIFVISVVIKNNLWIASSIGYAMVSHCILLIPKSFDPDASK